MKKLLKFIIFSVMVIIIIYYYQYNNFQKNILIKENKIIEIKAGETTKDLAKKLGINSLFLKKYLKNKNFKLLKGRFKIKNNSTINDIIESLKKPLANKQINITILEGWNIYDIDNYLSKKGYIIKNSYINYIQNPNKIKELSKFYNFITPNLQTLEGFLYPDTYTLQFPIQINKLVIKQLDNFEKKVYNKLLKNLNNNKIYNIIILSSIVEKEEKNIKNKPIVAGILRKRLENKWPIGADITVCYPHKLTSQECKMVISKYIKEKSDYNTRTMIGLPKTPIGNPSYETIYSTLNYKKTRYWYYLHNIKTGEIYFAETNKQHENNKKFMY